ncbi:Anoctamin, partial [Caligus rogercresseyi]
MAQSLHLASFSLSLSLDKSLATSKQLEILHLFLGESKKNDDEEGEEEGVPLKGQCPEYEGTFDDYLEMVIQFGYVSFFALLNNIIEIRSDAFKLCFVCKRPFGQRVKDIGSWVAVMDMMGAIGVVVNCALLTLPGRLTRVAPGLTPLAVIFGALILE